MNLEDVIDPEYGLQQDEWSLSKPVFGDEGQLEVVGWSGRKLSGNKKYILRCNTCCRDTDLLGDGYFKASKAHLIAGGVPCGCSKRPSWTEDQYYILCSRRAKELGYTFQGFIGDWNGSRTRVILSCKEHGQWSTNTIDNMRKGQGCPECGREVVRVACLKPEEDTIQSFFASGSFHPETKFWRSDRKDGRGFQAYWTMFCPDCGETADGYRGNLLLGQRACACSKQRQKESYINFLIDNNNIVVAIKFGIANNSKRRIKRQNRHSAYTLKQHSAYTFPDVASCKAAERECKQTLECGVVLKRDMPDGWTETTWLYNLEKIKAVYEKHGGVLNEL